MAPPAGHSAPADLRADRADVRRELSHGYRQIGMRLFDSHSRFQRFDPHSGFPLLRGLDSGSGGEGGQYSLFTLVVMVMVEVSAED